MGRMAEDFARCTECNNPYFQPIESVLIVKDSDFYEPVVKQISVQYRCIQCGNIQYHKK